MSRHRSPQRRRAHPEPPLPALVAAAGAGGAHRPVSLPQVVPTPARVIAAVVVGGALAAVAQHTLSTTLPKVSDGVSAVRASLDQAIGLTPTSATVAAVTPVTPAATAPAVADAAALVKAALLEHTAPVSVGAQAPIGALPAAVAALGTGVRVIPGPVTSGFGGRWGTFHEGLDIAAPIGTPIHAPLAGTVISSGPASGFGLWVRLQHADGTITVYGHINRSFVQVGQHVNAGDVIAETGNRGQSTGPHLHIGVMIDGTYVNPRPWLDAHGISY